VTSVADPLGISYDTKGLTDRLEEEIDIAGGEDSVWGSENILRIRKKHIESVRKNKESRNVLLWKKCVVALKDAADDGKNIIPYRIQATYAGGTTGEMMGKVRLAMGHSYDPMNILEAPF
jgi:methylmalonyl-CoA mutase N-terminal domain/subunit